MAPKVPPREGTRPAASAGRVSWPGGVVYYIGRRAPGTQHLQLLWFTAAQASTLAGVKSSRTTEPPRRAGVW